MSRTLKALSALLTYPTAELQDAAAEIGLALAEDKLLPGGVWRQLSKLATELATGDLYDLQERYVLLFDRTRSLSLHLFEHVHGGRCRRRLLRRAAAAGLRRVADTSSAKAVQITYG